MKNKILLSVALALFCTGSILAQPKVDGTPKAILQSDQLMNSPVWSPDGKKLAVTSLKNTGIWVVDENGKNLRQITDEPGAGYKIRWSSDNSTIIAKPFTSKNNRLYFSVKAYNTERQLEKTLISDVRNMQGSPYLSKDESEIAYSTGKELKKSATGLVRKAAITTKNETVFKKMLTEPGNVTSSISGLSQFAGKTLLNPTLSPLGDKIAFQIAGEGLFVCNSDASNVKSLGKGEGATWMPDGKYIIVFNTQDDGMNITSSSLYAVNIENGNYSELTIGNIVAVRPNVSSDGKKIAFEDYSTGSIYVANLK